MGQARWFLGAVGGGRVLRDAVPRILRTDIYATATKAGAALAATGRVLPCRRARWPSPRRSSPGW